MRSKQEMRVKKVGENNGFDNICVSTQGTFTMKDLNKILKHYKKKVI